MGGEEERECLWAVYLGRRYWTGPARGHVEAFRKALEATQVEYLGEVVAFAWEGGGPENMRFCLSYHLLKALGMWRGRDPYRKGGPLETARRGGGHEEAGEA